MTRHLLGSLFLAASFLPLSGEAAAEFPDYPATMSSTSITGSVGAAFHGSGTADFVGFTTTGIGDVNGDGFADWAVASFSEIAQERLGKVHVVFGGPGLPLRSASLASLDGTAGIVLTGTVHAAQFGNAIGPAGDVNGDGIADFVVAEKAAFSFRGRVHVFFGSEDEAQIARSSVELGGSKGFTVEGESAGDNFGSTVGAAGDLNADGFADVFVGAFGADIPAAGAGSLYVVLGRAQFPPVLASTPTAQSILRFDGSASNDGVGYSAAAVGDINGDGASDLAIGVPYFDSGQVGGQADVGAVFVVFGSATLPSTPLELAALPAASSLKIVGDSLYSNLGKNLAGGADFDGNGLPDLVASAPPLVYVIYDEAILPGTINLGTVGSGAFTQMFGLPGSETGSSLAALGDVDRDGLDDIAIGAPVDNGTNGNGAHGSAFIVLGRTGHPDLIPIADLLGHDGFRVEGVAEALGTSVGAPGDVDADGHPDILIGGPQSDPSGSPNAGTVYVVRGRPRFPLLHDGFE